MTDFNDALMIQAGRMNLAQMRDWDENRRKLFLTDLTRFVRESNRIEGITRTKQAHIDAQLRLLAVVNGDLTIADLVEFVSVVQPGAILRERPGLDVRVGNSAPPLGGPVVAYRLQTLIQVANKGHDPYAVHVEYEKLHPFTDGNGRSGRALWLYQMLQSNDILALRRGFLHTFYYQTLAAMDDRLY